MNPVIPLKPQSPEPSALARPGTVRSSGEDRRVEVDVDGATVSAWLAIPGSYVPAEGDPVLVLPGAGGRWYVVGVLATSDSPGEIALDDGTRATVSDGVLTVRDPRGELLFEHRPSERKTVVSVPTGDLELRAPDGCVDLVAGRSVRMRAEERVEVLGERGVKIESRPAGDTPGGSAVDLSPRRAAFSSPEVDVRARRVEVAADEGRVLVRTIDTVAERAKHVAGVIETEAGRIFERAKNVYRDVEELSQTRAGRLRMLAEGTLHMLGRRTVLKAEQDVKIKGEKIYLA